VRRRHLLRYFSESTTLDGKAQVFLRRGMALAMEWATQGLVVPAALACRPSIKPFRRCGSSSGARSSATISSSAHFIHEPRKLPVVLSMQEVARAARCRARG
jgi:hypothetical protein